MGELGALFNPGMRHEIEERESKQNRREEEGNARDGDLRIDLASGVAVINIPGRASAGPHDENQAPAEQAGRTVGEKPSAAASARRSAHLRAEERRSTSARADRSKDHASGDRTERTRSGAEKTETPRPSPSPSSKASRAAR